MSTKKKVLLARPSSLLVNNMKRLMVSAHLIPTPLKELNGFQGLSSSEIAGIVVSTTLSSCVKEEYWEVMKMAHEKFNGMPKFLASFANFKRAKLIARSSFKENGLALEALSIDEAYESDFVDFSNHFVIITREDLEDPAKFNSSSLLIKKLMPA